MRIELNVFLQSFETALFVQVAGDGTGLFLASRRVGSRSISCVIVCFLYFFNNHWLFRVHARAK